MPVLELDELESSELSSYDESSDELLESDDELESELDELELDDELLSASCCLLASSSAAFLRASSSAAFLRAASSAALRSCSTICWSRLFSASISSCVEEISEFTESISEPIATSSSSF